MIEKVEGLIDGVFAEDLKKDLPLRKF